MAVRLPRTPLRARAAAYRTRVASIFSVFTRPGRLPAPLRTQLEPEGIIHVAELVRVRQQFSGSIPGMVSGWGVNRHLGLMVLTRERLFALLPSIPRLKGPAIDARWDAEQHGRPGHGRDLGRGRATGRRREAGRPAFPR
jgi:hypothetical protein